MRVSRDSLSVMVLLAIFVVAGAMLGSHASAPQRRVGQEMGRDPSIYNDRASGSKGLFELVEKLGDQPTVWRRNWTELETSHSRLLLVIDPRIEPQFAMLTGNGSDTEGNDKTILAASDALSLKRWLSGGGGRTAVLLTSRLASSHQGGNQSGNSGPEATDSFGDALDVVVESASPDTGRAEFSPLQPTRDTAGILSIHCASGARISRSVPDAVTLFGDEAGPVVSVVPEGLGRLIVIADADFASNASLPRSENAVLIADLLAHYARPGEPVLFDEYHHGDVALGNESLWDVLGRPLQLALIQALFAAIVLIAVLSVRFGPPVPLMRGMTRTSAEYVTSVASLYRRARASVTALETLYRQFLRDLCARLALPPDVNLEQLAEVAARRGHIDKNALRRVLVACEQRLDEGKVSETELLDLTQQMEQIRKDMGIA